MRCLFEQILLSCYKKILKECFSDSKLIVSVISTNNYKMIDSYLTLYFKGALIFLRLLRCKKILNILNL